MKHKVYPDVFAQFFDRYVKPKPGRALICGSFVVEGKVDRRTLYPDAVGADMREGPGVDVVADLENPPNLGTFAHVDCVSTLEHVRRPWKMAEVLTDLLEPGGTILVTVPFIWRIHSYPDDYWRMSHNGIKSLFPDIEWTVEKYISTSVRDDLESQVIAGYRWFARTEVAMFGHKK